MTRPCLLHDTPPATAICLHPCSYSCWEAIPRASTQFVRLQGHLLDARQAGGRNVYTAALAMELLRDIHMV